MVLSGRCLTRLAERTTYMFRRSCKTFVRVPLVETDCSSRSNGASPLWSRPALVLVGGGLLIGFGACPPASCMLSDDESCGAAAAAAATVSHGAAAAATVSHGAA